MKIAVVVSLSSSLLIFLLFLSLSPASSSHLPPKPVFDIYGHPLLTGSEYYIFPTLLGSGGRGFITMGSPHNGSCPLDVVQEPLPHLSDGLPVILTPAASSNEKGTVIHHYADYNIKFSGASAAGVNTCGAHSSMVWRGGLRLPELSIVTTGGKESNHPYDRSMFNMMELETSGPHYILRMCGPAVCTEETCSPGFFCQNVGVHVDDGGKRRLALGGETLFVFVFVPKKI